MSDERPVLVPGETCWQIAEADRLSVIVDAADYFRHAKAAMLQARHRIVLIGWDFDTRIKLEPAEKTLDGPNRLGPFLKWLPEQNPDLEIHLLKWSLGAFAAVTRGMAPIFVENWLTDRKLHFEIDTAHPVGAAHHQKILVIDDQIAFCGGIDMTVDRWDTSDHSDRNGYRTKPNGKAYGPWHDATTAVDGAAARAVGEMARDRWKAATGRVLEPITDTVSDHWPQDLEPTMRSVDVAIARTLPTIPGREEAREVEALYLAAIAGAKRYLYVESQYLASRTLAEAMAERLREPEGPEIVLVLPRHADGWLEQETMDGARHTLLKMLWRADAGNRFSAYHPVTSSGEPIYVHAKILVMDDELLRVGSSNLNNRSLGFDSECDLAVEVRPDTVDAADRRTAIRGVRNRLLGEHLDIDPDEFQRTLDDTSSLIAAVEKHSGDGKTLVEFDHDVIDGEDSPLAENELMDPETAHTTMLQRTYRVIIGRRAARRQVVRSDV
ncbi:phosphatidylserine/phosphatidylglycerophosphate/cardiolipin synthase-like enzyme [Williamsia limnetica]|uniref:Phosphatidylserine/phosphatidylglycerophosphate/ cardiolipin synthase-like enzyme n=1 Tax=Williamsia limnetica TaxID=882452 RepID=A0A318RR54_WILLI|nr:phospholipase D-like domain-containing protein [Williamsia limnetica]PYE17896.1 phosphatidylserine/phosphatidylglycerophosphate/cardiolipin synthase-like enzyme [Williamsia limnetica]